MRIVIGLLAFLVLLGCSSSRRSLAQGDQSNAFDATANDGSFACTGDVRAVCSQPSVGCALQWSGIDRVGCSPIWTCTCGGYDVQFCLGIDSRQTSYYDRSTGAIVAIVDSVAAFGGKTDCVGPSGFVPPPNCEPPYCAHNAGDDASVLDGSANYGSTDASMSEASGNDGSTNAAIADAAPSETGP